MRSIRFLIPLCYAILGATLVAGPSIAADSDDWRSRATALALAEPKIEDALWSQDISFWVAVRDDGSRRDGYAEFVCLLTSEAGRPAGEFVAVTVLDWPTAKRELGKAYCR